MGQRRTVLYFSPQLFMFLRDLKKNNNRKWFTRNRPRYEKQLLEPSLRFVKDVAPRLRTISPYLVADPKPFAGSLFRIYRDIRFSKDKSPYKTNVAMQFWHKKGGKKIHAAGLYLHLSPGQSFAGAGVWHPDQATLNRVRKAIVEKPESWRRVRDSGLRVEGDSLKRPPIGFNPNHEFIKDLMLKSFTAGVRFRNSQVTSHRFLEEFVEAGKKLDPLNRFLSQALGLPW
jgi:uncharacterized protein (TIGR02453 family)